jgi:hypothetical protein
VGEGLLQSKTVEAVAVANAAERYRQWSGASGLQPGWPAGTNTSQNEGTPGTTYTYGMGNHGSSVCVCMCSQFHVCVR